MAADGKRGVIPAGRNFRGDRFQRKTYKGVKKTGPKGKKKATKKVAVKKKAPATPPAAAALMSAMMGG